MELLTKKEAAAKLRVSVTSLDRFRQRGEIRDVEYGSRHPGPGRRMVFFTEEEVERFIREHTASESRAGSVA